MSNVFVALPAPAGNGGGTAVDVSGFGTTHTITVNNLNGALVSIQIANDAGHANWTTIGQFQFTGGEQTFEIAAHWMRALVANYQSGGAPVVELGGDNTGTLFATLVAPAGNGSGAAVDVSLLGTFKTVQCTGPFQGLVNIQISEDAGTTWATAFTFQSGKTSQQTSPALAANRMRVNRVGVTGVGPAGTPVINVAAVAGGGGGGGSVVTDGVTIQGDGSIGAPIAILVVQHDATLTGNGAVGTPLSVVDPAQITLLNANAGVLVIGTAVYISAAGSFDAAEANAAGTANVLGLVDQAPSIGIGASGAIKSAGPMTATTAQWDAVTGDVGGIVFNAKYYLSPTTPGHITRTAPVAGGQVVAPIGSGVSATVLNIRIGNTVQL